METFVIEGTVSELYVKNDVCKCKLHGTEGYAIKQKNGKNTITLNVLCPADILVKDNKKPKNALLLFLDDEFSIEQDNKDYFVLLTTALSSGKKVRLEVEANDDKKLTISSVTLLSE